MDDLSLLQSIWLVAIAGLWVLYLVLEGFDFGVGMLLRRVRRDRYDRRVALHAIGPTWAANEVWVVIAVVAMFGAFPGWYAAWSSGLYLPLSVVLLALIARNVGIELIGKREDEAWRRRWERVIEVASTLAPFCWGLMWSAAVWGLELRGEDVAGSPLAVVTWYSVLGGLALVAVSRAQGAAFLVLRTSGEVRERAERELRLAAPVAALLGGGLLVWTAVGAGGSGLGVAGWGVAVLGVGALAVLVAGRRFGALAFAAGCAAVGLLVVTWFAALFPAGIAASDGGPGLSLASAAAGDYTLALMTILAAVLLPLILAAQVWSYWLFRHRLTRADVGERPPSPIDLIARLAERGRGGEGADPASPALAPLTAGGRGAPLPVDRRAVVRGGLDGQRGSGSAPASGAPAQPAEQGGPA